MNLINKESGDCFPKKVSQKGKQNKNSQQWL
jgi:hypothetical protein